MPRRWLNILTFGYVVFLAYGTLLPFDFALSKHTESTPSVYGLEIVDAGFPDVVGNIAMYVPLGLLLRALLDRAVIVNLGASLTALLLAGSLSFLLELVQTIVASRVSSVADVICNVVGALLGIVIFRPEQSVVRRLVPAVRNELLADTPTAIAGGWTIVTIITSLAPFDLTLDLSNLGRSLRNASFIPWERHDALSARLSGAAIDKLQTAALDTLYLWDLRMDYLVDFVMFLALGAVVARQGQRLGHGLMRSGFGAVLWVTTLAVAVTGAGLFVMSVGFDATHIVTRTGGGLVGIATYLGARPVWKSSTSSEHRLRRLRVRRWLQVSAALSMAFIAARELAPFSFDPARAGTKMAEIEWMPLHAYSRASIPVAMLDAMHKTFRFVTLGALIALFQRVGGSRYRARGRVAMGFLAATALIPLEFAQCWIPIRVPAVTDLILAGLGVGAGMWAGELLYTTYRRVRLEVAGTERRAVLYNVELPPPGAGAPRETSDPRAKKVRQ